MAFVNPKKQVEEKEEKEEKEEMEEMEEMEEGWPEANDEGDNRFTGEDDEGDPFKEAVFNDY